MATVAISADFLRAFSGVPKAQQKKVREFTEKFRTDPTMSSINYEPMHEAKDPKVRTVRIGQDFRAIVIHPPKGDVYLLAWVDHHDEAMAWAKNKRFDVNAATGALQVVDVEQVEHVEAAVTMDDEDSEPSIQSSARLFDEVGEQDLYDVGLPPLLVPSVRAIRDDSQLDELRAYLPEEAYEALFLLACGSSVEEALKEAKRVTEVDPDDFDQALQHPDTQRRFRVVESSDQLLDMLNAPLERWRVFLHPDQADLVRRRFNGPARVLGGAGTGKTVVAMHRAQ